MKKAWQIAFIRSFGCFIDGGSRKSPPAAYPLPRPLEPPSNTSAKTANALQLLRRIRPRSGQAGKCCQIIRGAIPTRHGIQSKHAFERSRYGRMIKNRMADA